MVSGPRQPHPGLGAPFWRLWSASAASNLADGIAKVVLPLVAVRLTRSPVLISGLTVAITLPWLLFALPAGALVDRVDRRRAMAAVNMMRALALAAGTVLVVADAASIWVLYAVAVAIGAAETVYDTAAQSILPQVVRREQLSRANSRLYAAELTANELAGPPLGGFLVASGVVVAFASPAALWTVAVVLLLTLRGRFAVERTIRTTMRADVMEGLAYLRGHRVLRTLAMMTGGFNFASSALLAIIVLFAVGPGSVMGLSEPAFGLLLACLAVGGLLGSFVAEAVEHRLGPRRSMVVGIVTASVAFGLPAVTSSPVVIGAGFVVSGVGVVVWNVIVVSLRQRITPERLLGRVNSSYRLLAWGSRPIGAVAGGMIAQLTGLREVFVVAAALVLGTLAGLVVLSDEELAGDAPAST